MPAYICGEAIMGKSLVTRKADKDPRIFCVFRKDCYEAIRKNVVEAKGLTIHLSTRTRVCNAARFLITRVSV